MTNNETLFSLRIWIVFVLIIMGGMGAMTVMSLQAPLPESVVATSAPSTHYRTLYYTTDYGAPAWHDGRPYVYDLVMFEGLTVNLTIVPKVLAVDSIYLMKITDKIHHTWWAMANRSTQLYMKNVETDFIKLAEYDMPANELFLENVKIPENTDGSSSWWIVCFCQDMGYRYGVVGNNPDGRVIIDIIVEG